MGHVRSQLLEEVADILQKSPYFDGHRSFRGRSYEGVTLEGGVGSPRHPGLRLRAERMAERTIRGKGKSPFSESSGRISHRATARHEPRDRPSA